MGKELERASAATTICGFVFFLPPSFPLVPFCTFPETFFCLSNMYLHAPFHLYTVFFVLFIIHFPFPPPPPRP